MFDVFLSHNSHEKPAVESLAYKLRATGLTPWLDKEQLIPGTRWQGGLAGGLRASATCAVFIGKDDLGNWESEELDVAQNRAANDHDFRIIPVLLPGLPDPFDPSPLPPFLLSRTWVDFRPGLDDATAFRRLFCAIKGIPPGPEDGGPIVITTDNPQTEMVPYLGLQTFDEADAGLFFGRDADVQRLVEKLKATRFLAVIGASGSGKSSLVRAGLVPVLRRNVLPGSGEWIIRVLRPGPHPLKELALRLVQIRGEDQDPDVLDELEQALRKNERALHNTVRLKLASLQLRPEDEARRRVLLVVDQFEEVFTLCRDDGERKQFLDNLLYASAALDGRSVVMLTLRADFYSKCAAHDGLSARIAAHQYLVGPMTQENLRQAIEEPARLAGLNVESELLAEVLAEVSNQPGALPLLEYALLEVWKGRRAGKLTLKAYVESGGVKKALAQRAEAIFAALSPNQQEIVQRVMLRLTQPGEGTDDTRRRARISELVTRADERDTVTEIINNLADERLLTTNNDEQLQERVVDVSHEALIRGWPRLRKWVDEDRAGLRTLLRLSEAAQEWQRDKFDEGLLYRGARLAVALEWQSNNESKLNDLERTFLIASETLKNSEEAEKQRAETEKKLSVKLRYFSVSLSLLLVLSIFASGVAYTQRQRALAETRTNQHLLYVANIRDAFQESERENIGKVQELLKPYLPPLSNVGFDLRGFEWFYLWHIYHNEEASLEGHSSIVSSVAFSPDGKMLASASGDSSVKLWDINAYREIARLRRHSDRVLSVAFSPDGRTLASASGDKTIKLWDVVAHQELATLKGHSDRVLSVAFSPDGKTLASASWDKAIKLWDATTYRELATLTGHSSVVSSVVFSPDGRILASASDDNSVRLWDAGTHTELATLRGHLLAVSSVAFSPDGRTLASASGDNTVKLWDATTHKELITLLGHSDRISSVAFSPDGRTLASASGDKTIKLWDVVAHQELATLKGHSDRVLSVAFSPDGKTLASASGDKTIKFWNASASQELTMLKGHSDRVLSVAFSSDGKILASSSGDNTVKLWDAMAGQELATLKGHTASVLSVAFSPDGRILASSSDDGTVKLWDTSTHTELTTLKGHSDKVLSVAFSPDGKTLASASGDSSVKLWDAMAGQEMTTLKGHSANVLSVAFSPDGKMLASASGDNTVKLWDVATRKELAALVGHLSGVVSAVFSPDGNTLASASGDKTVKLWNVSKRTEPTTLEGHLSGVWAVTFSPDGKTLASTGNDNIVRLWNADTQQELATLKMGPDIGYSVAFSPDGKMLVSGGKDGSVKMWSANTNNLARH